ncbi:HNH endonuclease signature motif containing protein [Megamonas hypermegale]|mgnify:CR=1 FL=1|jgi:hypothetical protein|uniref:HNH endonuclease signature motif containing protein n=1 Tax=Megamonas hypermegale TaxID=158847 RepID=UPI0026EE59C8|nr:HNH endonuclease signature motif containing protein [Megamonas hypermegale]
MANRYLPPKVIKELYAKSGNICAFPGCSCKLFFNDANLSEICHIQGLNPDSARYNSNLSSTEVNCIENLILLCPTHHSLVDQQPLEYTVERLKEMKNTHEEWVVQQLHNYNNSWESFSIELQKIFQECQFDIIFLEQNFCAPFPDIFFDYVEIGYTKIRNLLNSECVLSIPSYIREDLYSFTELMDYTLTGVAFGCFSNQSGYAIPHYVDEEAIEAIRENMKQIQEIYVKYRFKFSLSCPERT